MRVIQVRATRLLRGETVEVSYTRHASLDEMTDGEMLVRIRSQYRKLEEEQPNTQFLLQLEGIVEVQASMYELDGFGVMFWARH